MQARDRGLRHRALQREVPLVGAALRRGLAVADEPDRHVARHRRRVLDALQRLHRERVVAVPRDVGHGHDLRGLQGRAVLRPLRHRAVEPRAGPARRVPRRHRAVRLRALPVGRSRLRPPRVDHDTVDAALQRRRRGRARRRATSACASPEGGRDLVLARDRVAAVFGDDAEVVGADHGRRARRRALRAAVRSRRDRFPSTSGRAGFRVVADEFVTVDDGSGIVHLAPAFGEIDREVAEREGLPTVNPVNDAARFTAAVGPPYAGKFVKDADPALVDALAAAGKLVLVVDYTHSYPHCWRCDTPLIYWAKPTWFARTSAIKDALLRENETINWHPEHIKHGRFGDWLANNVDWALSRDRYWGTPIPVWRCGDCGHDTCVGSVAELSELSDRDLTGMDLHRPYVDDVTIRCPDCANGTADPHRARCSTRGSTPARCRPRSSTTRSRTGSVRVALPRRLHLRGDRPDPRLVLLAARGQHAGVRPDALPERRVPGAHRRPRRAEDVEVARQHDRPVVGAPDPGCGSAALVHVLVGIAVDPEARLRRRHRRGDPPVPAHAVERLLVLRDVREPRRVGPGGRPEKRRSERRRSGPFHPRPRPMGPVAAAPARCARSPMRSRRSTR